MGFVRISKTEGLARITELVNRYRALADELTKTGSTFTETDARVTYIDPLLEALGWDVRNLDGKSQRLSEVVMERTGSDVNGSWGRPDYRLRLDGTDVLPVEAKKPAVNISTDTDSAIQARSYGWSLSLPATVLTNFHELLIFDARVEPELRDKHDVALLPGGKFHFEEFITRFDELWNLISFESLSTQGLESVYNYIRPPRGDSPFDHRFLQEFRNWRLTLAQSIASNNPGLQAAEIGRRAQSLLNALLFLRVCEDRDIGKYQGLLESASAKKLVASFREADDSFNAGLFTVLASTQVDADDLAHVVREMYWPRTQFAFGVLDPTILGGVYEQYLAERVILDDSRLVSLEIKPELSHSGGVVATPEYIVREIGDLTLNPILSRSSAVELTVLDPAVGSGIFLLDAFERLVECAEKDGGTCDITKRGELVQKNLFGIDVDGAAVEVAKLSLLLAVLGTERIDLGKARHVLPDLSKNIIHGNTVVRENFDTLIPDVARVPSRRAEVSPLNIKSALGASFPRLGFDAIVGNPPYVRIQDLNLHLPDQLRYLKHALSRYEAPKANNFDLYLVFIERSLELLSPTGRLGMIVPNRFTSHLSGNGVRLKLGKRIEYMLNFGEQQVFPNRTTYTSIIVVGEESTSDLTVDMVDDLYEWRLKRTSTQIEIPRSLLGTGAWPFATSDQTTLFAQLDAHRIARLGDPGWVDIFVGVQTSADAWYFVDPTPSTDPKYMEFTDVTGVKTTIEKSLLRPAVKDQTIDYFDGQPDADKWVIFPYEIDPKSKKATLIPPVKMKSDYPQAFAYFDRHRQKLESGRNVAPNPGPAFWAYGRSQSLSELQGPKLIARVMSLIPRYALDQSDFVAPGGGDGGPYGFLRPSSSCAYSIDVIQAILSHPVVDLMVSVTGKRYRGSYAVHRKEFLKGIPVPELSVQDQERIEEIAKELREIAVHLRSEKDSQITKSISERRTLIGDEMESILTAAFKLDADLVAKVLQPE